MRKCPKCGNRFTASERLCPHDGSPLADTASVEERMIGQTLAGKYRIDSFLKRGGMGSVYRATHLMLNKTVAIKLIKPELVTSEDIVGRFHREAQAASQLTHPNIVTIHDLGQAEDGTLYIAMELVSGQSLKEIVTAEGPLTPDRAVGIAQAVAGALALAHKSQIIHRDLKPQNIMISEGPDGAEVPKLLDFGIAKTFEAEGPALTSTGMVLGTPQYMSPEQAGGKPVDARSDLYALGVILYEMLVGKVPFDDPSIPAILVKHLSEKPKPPSELRPELPSAVESIVLRCLAKEPQDRFQNAEEFSLALKVLQPTLAQAEVQPTVGLSALTRATAGAIQVPELPAAASVLPPAPPARLISSEPEPTVRAEQEKSERKSNKGLVLALCLAALLVGGTIFAFFVIGNDGLQETAATSAGTQPTKQATAPDPPNHRPEAPVATSSIPSAPSAAPSPAPPPSPETTEQPKGSAPPSPASPAPATPPAPAVTPLLPTLPSVHTSCRGLSDACASFQTALQHALERAGMAAAGDEQEAEILVAAFAEEIETRTEEQFGTTFVVRTYSIEVTGEADRFGETVTMPPPERVSFDTRFGAEKLNERSRVLADKVAATLQEYWSKKKAAW
jgi:serine/threonine protein kinase